MKEKENYIELREALSAILFNCDGARTVDGIGFNKYDTIFARQLHGENNWTVLTAIAAYSMMGKYRKQLSSLGIEYNNIPDPKKKKRSTNSKAEKIKKAEIKDNRIYLEFKLPKKEEWVKVLQEVKNLPGREYHSREKLWSVPVSEYTVKEVKNLGFTITGEIKEKKPTVLMTDDISKMVSLSGKSPFPFQVEGIKRLNELDGRVLLSDDMGLGKTLQAILYMKMNPELRPAIIVCPATLKINWSRELDDWVPEENYRIFQGRHEVIRGRDENIIIINYDILKDYLEFLMDINTQLVIFDEHHYLKNPKANRTKAGCSLAHGIDHILCVSGTPITNRPSEFFTGLNMLKPELFPNWFRYTQEFCNPVHNGFGWTYNGASNVEKLNSIIKSFMIRRIKEDVLKELPPKTKTVIPLEINNRSEYKRAKADIVSFIRSLEGDDAARRAQMARVLAEFNKLRQLAVTGKMNYISEWIDNFLETDQKIVLFAVHHKTIDFIMEKYGDIAVKLDGRDTPKRKQKAVDSFQENPEIKIFVGNIKAAGVGITLTAASTVAFLEVDWVPALHIQAEDRCQRIGQTADHVNIYYLVSENTIEEDMLKIIDEKNKVITAIIDGKDVKDSSLLFELFKKYQGG
ncbi:MAG: DEAD/DEAH box helicase [PVC group bacterium]|nr:DEAD/DEAH box helicase [PVC group bacterium]